MSALNDLLRAELAQVKRFIEVLGDERQALERADADALQAIGASKLELVKHLNASEASRLALIGLSGQAAGKTQMSEWLAQRPGETQATNTWQDILALAREARRLHETNGQLIALHLERTQEALSLLAQASPRDASLYGADGQATGQTGSRILDSA